MGIIDLKATCSICGKEIERNRNGAKSKVWICPEYYKKCNNIIET